jgi:DNA primase
MDAVDEVKSRLNIEDVIGEYVTLKRTGRNFKGLSPFNSEKTPSFVVSPEKQIFKDFSSGKGGSVFDFVMEVEGLDFKGALDLLARKAAVNLDDYRNGPSRAKGPNKDRLYRLLELAAKFYQVQFSKNVIALDYVLNRRKFTKDTALKWRLGYSPNNGSALIEFAKSKGFTDQEIKQAGLSSIGYRSNVHDMFRGRLMIPLQDNEGRVIGFTARLLEANDKAPKYINTPQTALYDKSRHVYGLHLAKESIRKNNYSVLVEGNLDVIASHQAGVIQTVATAGTALTEQQLKTLGRFSEDIRLCFDTDQAGLAASERAIPLASKANVSLSIIDIPTGKDPDELIKQDADTWREVVGHNRYALDWLIDRYNKLVDISSAKGKREFSDVLLPVVNRLEDPVERDHYLSLIAKMIDVSKDSLSQKMIIKAGPATSTHKLQTKVKPVEINKTSIEYQRSQDRFLGLMFMSKTLWLFKHDRVTIDMMPTKQGKELFGLLQSKLDFDIRSAKVVQKLSDYVKIESLLYEELYQGIELNELHDEAARLQADLVTKFVKMEKEKLSLAQRNSTDEAEIRLLQEKDKRYNLLLNQVKGAANG